MTFHPTLKCWIQVHCIYMYIVYTCTLYIQVHCIYMYIVYTCTLYIHVHCIYMYIVYTSTLYIHVHVVQAFLYRCTMNRKGLMYTHSVHVLMRDEKEGRKEASKVKQTTKQSNTAHPRQSLFPRMYTIHVHVHTCTFSPCMLYTYMYMYMYTIPSPLHGRLAV